MLTCSLSVGLTLNVGSPAKEALVCAGYRFVAGTSAMRTLRKNRATLALALHALDGERVFSIY